MNKYIFIAEFKGGTYISEVKSHDEISAIKLWAEIPNESMLESIYGKTHSSQWAKYLLNDIHSGEKIYYEIYGIENVWFFQFSQDDSFVSVNLILSR